MKKIAALLYIHTELSGSINHWKISLNMLKMETSAASQAEYSEYILTAKISIRVRIKKTL